MIFENKSNNSAALPLDVRKGFAFPLTVVKDFEAMPHLRGQFEAQPLTKIEDLAERQSLSAHRRAKPDNLLSVRIIFQTTY